MTLLLLNTTLKISLILVAALAASTLLRRRSAAVRHFVLAAALACAAATPFVRIVAPAWHSASRLQLIDRPLAVLDDSASTTPSSAAHAPAGRSIDATAIMRAVGVVWMTGAGLAMLVLLVGLSRLSWIAAHARRIAGGRGSMRSRRSRVRTAFALLRLSCKAIISRCWEHGECCARKCYCRPML